MATETKARHAHGLSENVDSAIQAGTIDAYDVLFLDAGTDNPKIGWVSKDGRKIVVNEHLNENLDALEAAIEKKASKEEMEEKLDKAVLDVVDIANAYTDTQIETKIAEVSNVIEIIEF